MVGIGSVVPTKFIVIIYIPGSNTSEKDRQGVHIGNVRVGYHLLQLLDLSLLLQKLLAESLYRGLASGDSSLKTGRWVC